MYQKETGASRMAQCVKELARKPNDLSSIPGTHMIEENRLLQVVL